MIAGGAARVEIGRDRWWHTERETPAGVERRLVEVERRERQEHGDYARGGHRPQAVVAGEFEVVRGDRPDFRRERRPAAVGELVDVQFRPQPVGPGDG